MALLGNRKANWVLADKGYDSQAILDHIKTMGAMAVVPSKSNRKHSAVATKNWIDSAIESKAASPASSTSAASPHDTKTQN